MYFFKEKKEIVFFIIRNLLGGDFDEFFYQLYSFVQLVVEQDFCGYLELDFIVFLEQEVEVYGVFFIFLFVECEVDQFLLKENIVMLGFIFSIFKVKVI